MKVLRPLYYFVKKGWKFSKRKALHWSCLYAKIVKVRLNLLKLLNIHNLQLTRDLGLQHFHTFLQAICEYVHMSAKEAVLPLLLLHQAKSDYSQTDITSGFHSRVFIRTCCAKVGWMKDLRDPNAGEKRATTGQEINTGNRNILAQVWLYRFWEVISGNIACCSFVWPQ